MCEDLVPVSYECELLVLIPAMCEELIPILQMVPIFRVNREFVPFFTYKKNWYQFFTYKRNQYDSSHLIGIGIDSPHSQKQVTDVATTYQLFTRQLISMCEELVPFFTCVKNS